MHNYKSAVELVEYASVTFGDKSAFKDAFKEISFNELRTFARRFATGLTDNVPTGSHLPVMVYLPKSVESIISFMGAMYGGSPYVPMDYNVPMERFRVTVSNLCPTAVITDAKGRDKLKEAGIEVPILVYEELLSDTINNERIDNIIRNTTDLDPSYIMYTSGSTGTPKGVTIHHRAVLDYTRWLTDTFDVTQDSIIGMQSAFHFDNSVFDILHFVADKNIPLLKVERVEPTLESLFMEVTGK